ncbi:DUF883 family protein [Amaricoccus solimangrovi]|uniref:DUF883 family protein n=1 Tax=Amaricoccus solimangrovi TaxID=2589815 RepID=A0A501WS05_9RHOB|nr:DUF883 family protein [Amaricoccus solimangrovi]TPE52523.1 DUF883 family protein [Amaricoccus solimangrovi]
MASTIREKTRAALSDLPDLEEIRDEIALLRRQMDKMSSRALVDGSRQARRLRDRTAARADDLYADAEALLGELGREFRLVERRARTTVRDHPAQSAAVALVGVGLLLALLWRR